MDNNVTAIIVTIALFSLSNLGVFLYKFGALTAQFEADRENIRELQEWRRDHEAFHRSDGSDRIWGQ